MNAEKGIYMEIESHSLFIHRLIILIIIDLWILY